MGGIPNGASGAGRKPEHGEVLVRYAGEPGVYDNPVEPNLEDVFLYLYRDEKKE